MNDTLQAAAFAVDREIPPSAARIQEAMVTAWPRLAGRVTVVGNPLDTFTLGADDVVVSGHACGGLTDDILHRATRARAA